MNKISKLSLAVIISLGSFSCENKFTNNNLGKSSNITSSINSANKETGTVSLTINKSLFNKGFNVKGADFTNSLIHRVRLEIYGTGIAAEGISDTKDFNPATSGAISFNIANVLAGNNRIMVLSTLDADNNVLSKLMGSLNVLAGVGNTGKISFFETAVAQVLWDILKSSKPTLLDTLNADNVRTYVRNVTGFDEVNNRFNKFSPNKINYPIISKNILDTNGTLPAENIANLEASGQVTINLNTTGVKLMINDPNSPMVTTSTASTILTGVSYGTWNIVAMKQGFKPKVVQVTVSAATPSPSLDISLVDLFERYVSLGDSLTAGYQNGAVQRDKQEVNYPITLYKSGGKDPINFQQGYINEPLTGRGFGGVDGSGFYGELNPDGSRQRLSVSQATLPTILSNRTYPLPYNNLGIAGATLDEILNTTLKADNPFFSFVLRNTGVATDKSAVDQALLLNPTLITFWAGNNDVLGAATGGNSTSVTPLANFKASYSAALTKLLAQTTADIFVANIPDVTSIPFTSSIPVQGFTDTVNKTLPIAQFPTGNPASPLTTAGPVPTEEKNVKYFLINTLAELPKLQTGAITQIAAKNTLTEEEVASLKTTVDGYNAIIAEEVAKNRRLTLVDMNAFLKDVKAGKIAGVTGGVYLLDPTTLFSFDSVHPNSKGYKLVAGKFMEYINRRYASNHLVQ